MDKEIYGYISLIFVLASFAPYIWSTWKGKTRPHVFTWAIWALVITIGTAGQYSANAGPGAWSTTASAVFCLVITFMALRQGNRNITRNDVIIFIAALCAIPVWRLTDNPFWAIVIVTIIDLMGYVPTFRKARVKPHEEMAFHYVMANCKHIAAFFAMTAYSWTTLLYPAAMLFANSVLIGMIYWWRFSGKKRKPGGGEDLPIHPD